MNIYFIIMNFYVLPPVHSISREKTQKKQFELLPCSWDCLSVPYLHVLQLNIWLVLGDFSFNCCASLCHATHSLLHTSSIQIHYLLFVPVVLFWMGHWIFSRLHLLLPASNGNNVWGCEVQRTGNYSCLWFASFKEKEFRLHFSASMWK